MYKDFFKQLGLSNEQSAIYLSLVEKGPNQARKIALETKIPRTLCYKILADMIQQGLVYKEETPEKPVAVFFPSPPSAFRNLITKKKEVIEHLDTSFNTLAGSLSAEWNRMWKKPSISLYEGVDGIKRIYDDILDSKESEICVISSPLDMDNDVRLIMKDRIAQQARRGIRTRAITPLREDLINTIKQEIDEKNLITRKKLTQAELPIPAQLIIYGESVSITNFSNNVTNFVIHSKKTADTLRLIFDLLWKKI